MELSAAHVLVGSAFTGTQWFTVSVTAAGELLLADGPTVADSRPLVVGRFTSERQARRQARRMLDAHRASACGDRPVRRGEHAPELTNTPPAPGASLVNEGPVPADVLLRSLRARKPQ